VINPLSSGSLDITSNKTLKKYKLKIIQRKKGSKATKKIDLPLEEIKE
jgi:hypothetical protein